MLKHAMAGRSADHSPDGMIGRVNTLMWEAKAADGRADELVAWALVHAAPAAAIYRSADDRVVVIDPSGQGLPDTPAALVTRPPHEWPFQPVSR